MIDLDAYLDRIGWTGSREPTLDTLRGLAAAHAAAIPFENLDPLLGVPVALDAAALERKLVQDGRGGYCFEHNGVFAAALVALGFTPTPLAARVLWNQPEDAINPRSHMLLRVDLDGHIYIADVGFGGMTLTGALALDAGTAQDTAHEPFRLIETDGDWRLQGRVRGEWKSLYRFDLQRQHPVDYEAPNYFLSTHPRSHFVSNLWAARTAPGRRLALLNRVFTVHHLGGDSERRVLGGAAEIRAVLERDFLLRLPDHPDLMRRLDALPMPA